MQKGKTREKTIALLAGGVLTAAASAWVALTGQTSILAAGNAGVITGVVTSAKGPEAGVWVIAETDDLQTRFRKIVVTNDQGKYVLPELPQASYRVWVRGYGLVDSKPVTAKPDQSLNLTALLAKSAQEAAEFYPASYWAVLIEPPKPDQFPGTGPQGNGINPALKTQSDYINIIKSCERCHQLGSKITRTIPDNDHFPSAIEAWGDRVQRGQRGAEMASFLVRFGRPSALKKFSDWTDRVAAGELPPAPPRPKGSERNVVITMWNWGDQYGLIHDAISTDRRSAFPFKIFVKQSALDAWAKLNGRPLTSSEEYAVAKMRLFQAFDEGSVQAPPDGQQAAEVLVDESNLEEFLKQLGI